MAKLSLQPDSLGYILSAAAQAVTQVRSGTALPQALARTWNKLETSAATRGAIQDVSYRTMRQWGRAERLLNELVSKPPQAPQLYSLLLCSLVLLCKNDAAAETAYSEFTVVDQAVNAAAADRKIAFGKGMVNAVLRRFLRERDSLMQQVMQQPVAYWNYPQWWIDAVAHVYPQCWEQVLQAGNQAPPLTLRVNARKTSVSQYLEKLQQHGMNGRPIGTFAIRLDKPVPVQQIPGFAEGEVSVQDAAAQLAAPLLDLQDGMHVLDACAAPGGKTGHMLESAAIDLLALDSDAQRLQRIGENLQRLQLHARAQVGDAGSKDWWDGRPFDRILADVPCTASGIVRRHPDIRWLRRPGDAVQLATLSAQILDNLWQMLRPGGKLLFVTCSLWPQESSDQAEAFALRNSAVRLDAPGQLLPVANEKNDHDGLFYALFQKPAN